MNKPRVLVLSLGGTIAMASGQDGVVPTLSAPDLINAVPQLSRIAEVEAISFAQLPGAHLGFREMVEVAQFIKQRSSNVDGFVITQGTDTIEETSFALDLLLDIDTPVVVTGAMRNPTVPGADGPANLLASVGVAISERIRNIGVLVVMNDEIHSPRFVQKAHSTNPAAFSSLPFGPLGSIREDEIDLYAVPARQPTLTGVGSNDHFPRVALVGTGLGDDGEVLRAIASSGADGIVLEATGGGHVSPAVAEAISHISKSIPVVVSTRTRRGSTLRSTYGFVGSEIDLRRRGAIFAGALSGVKARVALTLLCASNVKTTDIEKWFGAT